MVDKFEIKDLGTIAISLLVVAIVIGLGATILESIKDNTPDQTNFFGNETITWTGNNTAIGLSHPEVSSVVVYNNGTIMLEAGNYSVNGNTGSITFTNSSLLWNATAEQTHVPHSIVTNALNVSYSFSIGSAARNATASGITGIVTLSSYIPTIALVAVAAIVVGIVLVFFARRSGQ